MLQSARGPLIIEVNSSPGLKGIETATGLDIAAEIISYIERSAGKTTSRDIIGV
jgi:ribosomal protein S6--L-glutamate ligase